MAVLAGRLKEAMEIARKYDAEGDWITAMKVAHALALAGRNAEAWTVAAGMDSKYGIKSRCFIAGRNCEAIGPNNLATWIDALPSPFERATIDLAVALEKSGRHLKLFEQTIKDISVR